MTLPRLILDAGPLIALFAAQDPDHSAAQSGFEQLAQSKTQLITPIPIIYEVYKWLLYQTSSAIAQSALKAMRQSLDEVVTSSIELEAIQALVTLIPGWNGSLEDATVILYAQKHHCPVWTMNYRDFGVFKDLSFWNPQPS
jgi:predicted nucleic acid-binding protein